MNAGSTGSTTATPTRATTPVDGAGPEAAYASPHEHVADLLARHDWLLRRELARSRPRKPSDLLGFAAITDEEVDRLLGQADPREGEAARAPEIHKFEQAAADLRRRIDSRVKQTLASGGRLPVIELAQRFALSAFEIDILVACLATEIDRRYERIYGYLHDDMSRKLPSPGLILSLCCDHPAQQLSTRSVLGPVAPLRHYRIVDVADDAGTLPWYARPVRIDERIVSFLLGDRSVDGRIAPYVSWLDSGSDAIYLTHSQRAELAKLIELANRCRGAGRARQKPLVYLYGARNAGAEAMVRESARRLGVPVLTIDAELLCEPSLDFDQMVFLLFREGLLSQAALFLQNVDRALDQDPGGLRYRALIRHVVEMGGIVFLSGERSWRWPLPPEPIVLRPVELRAGGFIEQLEAWRVQVGTDIADADLHQLMSRHPLPPAAISAACRLARTFADLGGAGQPVAIGHLEEACRAQARAPASGLARRIVPKHGWEDLVLPAVQCEQLRAVCSQAKHLATVYGAWGFERKLSLGKGLNALFSGPPGTGKTMAAEVIAIDLQVEILKIDLSQIVSKYIGETEKNLRQLFDQAAAAHAILFFDEADALLGKRSEVKDAHDRYANTEVAYLLQQMEEYEGITILATNLRQNMDEAFTRRMRFIVEFPFPEEDDRLRIWEGVWPKEVPLAKDVDLQLLAQQYRLSGGSIRNIALAAAFLAAEHGQPVTMGHLLQATKRELQKMGRLINDNEYRKHG